MPDSTEALLLSLIVAAFFLSAIPGYVLARRRGLSAPAVAFVPIVGLWIVVFRSIGWTGWLLGLLVALVVLTPYIGLVVTSWAGVQLPAVQRRSRWWSALLSVPVINVVGYWMYAFTLPKASDLSLSDS
jgi:uncharacterized membrane protein